MFKEKIREILELVFETEEKTNVFVAFNYDTRSKVLMVVAGGETFVMSDNKYLYLSSGQCRDCLKKLLEEGVRDDGFVDLNLRKFYRAQAYTAEVVGNPFNTVGQTIELCETRQMEDGTELKWYVHSYIMSRTLKLGNSKLIDTYSANNAPFNSNSRQLGKDTPEISATVNRTRAELPVVSYEFTDGSDFSSQSAEGSGTKRKLVQLRCLKQMKYDDYKALSEAEQKNGTVYYTYEDTK